MTSAWTVLWLNMSSSSCGDLLWSCWFDLTETWWAFFRVLDVYLKQLSSSLQKKIICRLIMDGNSSELCQSNRKKKQNHTIEQPEGDGVIEAEEAREDWLTTRETGGGGRRVGWGGVGGIQLSRLFQSSSITSLQVSLLISHISFTRVVNRCQ